MRDTTLDDRLIKPIKAQGVDEDPIESNRRLFTGKLAWFMAFYAGFYALFHMLALNGVSIANWTGIAVPFFAIVPTGDLELSHPSRGRCSGAWVPVFFSAAVCQQYR